jgi:epoxyqueuosine reductase
MADPIREAIRDRALASGFDAVGFAAAHLDAEARAGLGEFISLWREPERRL